ncbi:MAG: DMT family transporter [Candidatus Methanosuratincola verstraetei]
MPNPLNEKQKAIASLFISTLIWGISFPMIKVALYDVDPLLFVCVRFILASLLVIAYLLFTRRRVRRLLRGRVLWILGITNGVGFAMETYGMSFTTASKASLLVNVNVVFMAIFSSLLLGERLNNRSKLGILMGLLGVFLTTTGGDLSVLSSGSAIGDAIIFAGGIIWAYSMIYNKKAATQEGLTPMEVTESMILTSTVALLPFLPLSSFKFEPNPLSISAMVYVALLCTIVAFFLFYKALQKLTVVNSGMVMLFEIVIAIGVSFLFLGETLLPVGVFGGLLIAIGILLVS